jgi:hypothetical protein
MFVAEDVRSIRISSETSVREAFQLIGSGLHPPHRILHPLSQTRIAIHFSQRFSKFTRSRISVDRTIEAAVQHLAAVLGRPIDAM